MTQPTLADRRCFNHARREAVARCPECGRFFCRECITEHDDRVVCAACLSKSAGSQGGRVGLRRRLTRAVQFSLAFALIWLCFHCLGQALLSIPVDFHDGTLWRRAAWMSEP
jgi:hypothetical protein